MNKHYTQEELAQAKRDGDITTKGVAYLWWLVNRDGAGFALLREPHHTDIDIALAAAMIQADRDVVGRITVRRPLPANAPDQLKPGEFTTKHSPGPWLAYNSEGNSGRILKHWRIRGDCVRNDPPFAIIDSGGKLSPKYEAANARLIAAAPDLLTALELYVTDCELERLEYNSDTLNAARAAIAKAKGE